MTTPVFKIEPYRRHDKDINIYGDDLRISVDHDDVDHQVVEDLLNKMVSILNEHWDRDGNHETCQP